MKPALGLARIFRPRHSRLRICRNMISSLANLRNCLDVKVQGSGGFAKTSDASVRFVRAHYLAAPQAVGLAGISMIFFAVVLWTLCTQTCLEYRD